MLQSAELGLLPSGLTAIISGGVVCSFPLQNAQNPIFLGDTRIPKSVGLLPRSTDIMTHLPETGSFLNSDIQTPRN
jgi:hypothetical protein